MEWLNEKLDSITSLFQNLELVPAILVGIIILIVWFLPALLALMLNRRHAKAIALACIPGGLSVIAWCGLLGWAVSGKVVERYKKN